MVERVAGEREHDRHDVRPVRARGGEPRHPGRGEPLARGHDSPLSSATAASKRSRSRSITERPGGRHPVHDPLGRPASRIRSSSRGVGGRAHDCRRGSRGRLRARAQLRDPLEHLAARAVREPHVAEGRTRSSTPRPVAADQHRRVRRLGGLRPRPDALEVHEAPVVARLVLRPDRLHRLDALAQQLHPGARVGAVVAHLLPVPAGADAELQPAAGEVVDARDLLGGDDRVALDDEADAAADPQVRRRGGRRRQRDEQVVGVRVLARQLAAAARRASRGWRGCACARRSRAPRAVLLDEAGDLAGAGRVVGGEVADAGVHALEARSRPEPSLGCPRAWETASRVRLADPAGRCDGARAAATAADRDAERPARVGLLRARRATSVRRRWRSLDASTRVLTRAGSAGPAPSQARGGTARPRYRRRRGSLSGTLVEVDLGGVADSASRAVVLDAPPQASMPHPAARHGSRPLLESGATPSPTLVRDRRRRSRSGCGRRARRRDGAPGRRSGADRPACRRAASGK